MDAENTPVKALRVAIDPGHLRSFMRMWKDSADLRIPMRDEFKVHFMGNRRGILENFEKTATAWLMAFRGADPDEEDRKAFGDLVAEIEAFRDWAKSETAALAELGRGEG